MSEFISIGFTTNELRLINNWRIYFQVNTLVELCNPEGTRIREEYLKEPTRRIPNKVNPTILQWPNQGNAGKRGFNLWLRALRLSFNMIAKGSINHHFGQWKESNILIKNNSWNHFVQLPTGSLLTRSQ
jgi:hypothetical protein